MESQFFESLERQDENVNNESLYNEDGNFPDEETCVNRDSTGVTSFMSAVFRLDSKDTEENKVFIKNIGLIKIIIAELMKKYNSVEKDLIVSGALLGFTKAYNGYKKESETKFSTFLGTCIRNEILMIVFNESQYIKKKKYFITLAENKPLAESPDISSKIEELDDFLLLLEKILNELDEKERTVILYKMSGCSQKEIAERMALGQPYISRILNQVYKKLKAPTQTKKVKESKLNIELAYKAQGEIILKLKDKKVEEVNEKNLSIDFSVVKISETENKNAIIEFKNTDATLKFLPTILLGMYGFKTKTAEKKETSKEVNKRERSIKQLTLEEKLTKLGLLDNGEDPFEVLTFCLNRKDELLKASILYYLAGKTQGEIAKMLNVQQSYISRKFKHMKKVLKDRSYRRKMETDCEKETAVDNNKEHEITIKNKDNKLQINFADGTQLFLEDEMKTYEILLKILKPNEKYIKQIK